MMAAGRIFRWFRSYASSMVMFDGVRRKWSTWHMGRRSGRSTGADSDGCRIRILPFGMAAVLWQPLLLVPL